MNRREKCRCISLVLTYLIGIASVVAMIYGGVHIFRVSKTAAESDGLTMLAPFYKCSDVVDAVADGAYSVGTVKHAVGQQCLANQLPARLAMGFAAGFMILALLCVPCAFKKDKWFGFTMWSTLAIATIIMSAIVTASMALPVASHFADCRHYDQPTISELAQYGVVCLKGPEPMPSLTSGLKWMCKMCMYFGGSAASVATLLLFFCIKSCRCCDPNAQCCSGNGCGGAQNGEHPCPIRRAIGQFKARFCRRSQLASSVDRDDGLPVSAPSYYEAQPSEAEGVSEDAGAPNPYYGVN